MGDLRDKVTALRCNSWAELTEAFEELSYVTNGGKTNHWIYRGEADAGWWLQPSIERFRESLAAAECPYSIRELERQLLYDFQSSAAQFLDNLPSVHETLEWLAVLQHYGTPTRLLDWTYSPTVAAYVALREKLAAGKEACVWALNLRKLRKLVIKRSRKRNWDTAYKAAIRQVEQDKRPAFITPFLPQNRYSRMSSQQGLFLVKTVAESPFMATLDDMCPLNDRDFIRRLLIPHSERVRILGHLIEHNTHEVGIFPDADGFGRFVRIKVEVQAQTLGLF